MKGKDLFSHDLFPQILVSSTSFWRLSIAVRFSNQLRLIRFFLTGRGRHNRIPAHTRCTALVGTVSARYWHRGGTVSAPCWNAAVPTVVVSAQFSHPSFRGGRARVETFSSIARSCVLLTRGSHLSGARARMLWTRGPVRLHGRARALPHFRRRLQTSRINFCVPFGRGQRRK